MSEELQQVVAKAATERDAHIAEMARFHFGDNTGCDFWLDWKKTCGFNPETDINGLDDVIRLFGKFNPKLLKTVEPKLWIPRAYKDDPDTWTMFPTGGTTGQPSMRCGRIGLKSDYARDYLRYAKMLPEEHFPRGGTCLYIGPTSRRLPRGIELIAGEFGCIFTVCDFDAPWMKAKTNGSKPQYKDHLVDKAIAAIMRFKPDWIFCPPILVQAMAERPGFDWTKTSVKGIISGGTEMNNETLRYIREELLQNKIAFYPIFGNALAGLAPSSPLSTPENPIPGEVLYQANYYPLAPHTLFRVVEFDDSRKAVPVGKRGRMQITCITPEWWMPLYDERDEATARPPTLKFPTEGVTDVGPSEADRATMELGVY